MAPRLTPRKATLESGTLRLEFLPRHLAGASLASMRDVPFDSITIDTLQQLQQAGATESRDLDFKRDLPGKTDADKKEFLADVSSFANTIGGDLLFGADEEREDGKKTSRIGKLSGLSPLGLDDEQQRLENILRNGLDPRVPGLRLGRVDGGAVGPLLVLRIPRSWVGPHMIKETGRFYMRNSSGKHQLDVREIRAAFLESDSAATRATQFRRERVAELLSGAGLTNGYAGPMWCLHVIPVGGLRGRDRDVSQHQDAKRLPVLPLEFRNSGSRNNLDGLIRTLGNDFKVPCYTQIFRQGAIEAVDAVRLNHGTPDRKIAAGVIEQTIIQCGDAYVRFLRTAGVDSPLALSASFLRLRGFRLSRGSAEDVFADSREWQAFDRDEVLIPEVVIEGIDVSPQAVRPLIDMMWQAAAHPGSPYFDEKGQWTLSGKAFG